MKKVAIIVQRYGTEVNGGAEYHARILADQLAKTYSIEVLTSCAKDYYTWANEYPEGSTTVDGIEVNRFKVKQERNKGKVHFLLKRLNKRTLLQQGLRRLGLLDKLEKLLSLHYNFKELGDEWSKQQGPFVPDLITYLHKNEYRFDALIFFTYLYYPTFYGLQVAPHKSILIPTAHNEPAITLPVFRDFFHLPKAILYNTISEQRLVQGLFKNESIYSDVVGIGIFSPEVEPKINPVDVLKSDVPYLIYIGRIDPGKGSDIMFSFFLKFRAEFKQAVKLVLIGNSTTEVPQHPDIKFLGFTDEGLKLAMLRGAKALIMPSEHESLSLVTLESLQNGIPVIVNGASEVLVDHVIRSKAGGIFTDYKSFAESANIFLNKSDASGSVSDRAKAYIHDNYSWSIVMEKFNKAIDYVSG